MSNAVLPLKGDAPYNRQVELLLPTSVNQQLPVQHEGLMVGGQERNPFHWLSVPKLTNHYGLLGYGS
jgi:hypothetical protein